MNLVMPSGSYILRVAKLQMMVVIMVPLCGLAFMIIPIAILIKLKNNPF